MGIVWKKRPPGKCSRYLEWLLQCFPLTSMSTHSAIWSWGGYRYDEQSLLHRFVSCNRISVRNQRRRDHARQRLSVWHRLFRFLRQTSSSHVQFKIITFAGELVTAETARPCNSNCSDASITTPGQCGGQLGSFNVYTLNSSPFPTRLNFDVVVNVSRFKLLTCIFQFFCCLI